VPDRAHPLGGQFHDLDLHRRTSSVDRAERGEPAVQEVEAAPGGQAQAPSIAGAEL
jgi:hypothetical protein